jgi:DNA polymerase-3 subunit beta
MADIVRSLPAAAIEVSVSGNRAHITCGRSVFTLPTMPVAEYPPIPELPEISGTVVGSDLAAAVAQVVTASSRDETLPAFTGVKVDVDGATIVLAATDRYRLAVRELQWTPGSTTISTHALIPARFLSDTAKMLANCPRVGLAFTSASEGIIGVEGDGRQSVSRLLAADFPKYQSLLPSESAAVAQVNTGAMLEAVKRVSLVLDREAPVRVQFASGEARITAGGGSGDIAEAEEFIECSLAGDEVAIAFNHQFLLDGLHAIDASTAVIAMTTATRPAVITGATELDGPAADSFKYLLMPIRQP